MPTPEKTDQVIHQQELKRHQKERRKVPHWSLIIAALMMFAALLYMVIGYLSPLTLSIAILIILYPSRRTRELKPLLLLVSLVVIASIWWRLNALITPFIIAFILAYAIDPVVEWLVKRGLPRLVVILVLIGLILAAMIGVGILIIPKLIDEIGDLAGTVPRWIDGLKSWGETSLIPWLDRMDIPLSGIWDQIKAKIPSIINTVVESFTKWSFKALSGAVAVLSGLANLILIPILTVYFLFEFNNIKKKVFNIVPDDHKDFALELYRDLNQVLSAYVRGQMLVCLFLATWIGIGLWLIADVPYALLLGITAGLANLLPYVGTACAAILTLLVALLQPRPFLTGFKTLIVFVSAQTLEGNLLTPRIVGDRVGLHPLVVIFAVLLFATLFGFIGMLVAIPVTASIQVIVRSWIRRSKQLKSAQ